MQSLSRQQRFLLHLAATVWNRRGAAKRAGLPFNEETVTESLLLDLQCWFPGNVTIVPFNKKQEAEVGADWAWVFVDADGATCRPMLIQAKRLDDLDKRYSQLHHQTAPKDGGAHSQSQMDRLLATAKRYGLPPVYAFYNHLDDPSRLVNNCGSIISSASANAESWGVTLASAVAVRDAMPDNTFDRHRRHSFPLHCLLCTRGAGDHRPRSLADAASRALTMLFPHDITVDDTEPSWQPPFRPLMSIPEFFLRSESLPNQDDSGYRGWKAAINAIADRMNKGDLCWIRHPDGNTFHIGKIAGQWEYRSTREYLEADMVNVRPCIWYGHPTCPRGISWKRGMTLQRVGDADAIRESADLYYRLAAIRE